MPRADPAQWETRQKQPCDTQALDRDAFRECLRKLVQKQGRITRVDSTEDEKGKSFVAWGYCTACSTGCTSKWRFRTLASEEPHIVWECQGKCAEEPAAEARKRHCQRLVHLAPMQAKAQCISESLPPAEMPSLHDLRKARKNQLAKDNGKDFSLDVSGDWLRFLQDAPNDHESLGPAKFVYLPLKGEAPWLPLGLALADPPVPVEGSTLMVSKNFLDVTRKLLATGHRQTKSVLCCVDATYKISVTGWAVLVIGLPNKHGCDRQDNKVPRSELVPIALGWLPTESKASLMCAMITCMDYYQTHGIDLRQSISAFMVDGGVGALSALAQVFPKLPLRRDLRHILVNCRGLSPDIAPMVFRTYLAGEVNFAAFLPTRLSFHLFWEQILAELAVAKRFALLTWIRTCLLSLQDGMWTAAWQGGLCSSCVPGYTTACGNQGLERFNLSMKQGLPDNYSAMSLTTVAPRLEAAVRTVFCQKAWVHEESEEVRDWQPEAAYAQPCRELLFGSPLQSDRLAWEEDRQRKQPSAFKFWQQCPANFVETQERCVWNGWKASGFFTFHQDLPSEVIDGDTHAAFTALLRAEDHATAWQALEALSLLKKDNSFPDGRLKLANFRALMTNLCVVFPLVKKQFGVQAVCTCITFMKLGSCCHELLVRYFQGDSAIRMAPMSAMTSSSSATLLETEDELRTSKRKGRPPSLPSRSAWLTMSNLWKRVEAQREKKREAKNEKREAAWLLFKHGADTEAEPVQTLRGQERELVLLKIAEKLADDAFNVRCLAWRPSSWILKIPGTVFHLDALRLCFTTTTSSSRLCDLASSSSGRTTSSS
ncbi:unnamed protein product [Durusdinium trenchii]|uniref:Uncharacterized protein n=1 Tax=Durusdinium trenchii TaxID=1381693 RepID=A0ABP0I246_9DINO